MAWPRSIFLTRETPALSTSLMTRGSMSSLFLRTSCSVSTDKGALTSMGWGPRSIALELLGGLVELHAIVADLRDQAARFDHAEPVLAREIRDFIRHVLRGRLALDATCPDTVLSHR